MIDDDKRFKRTLPPGASFVDEEVFIAAFTRLSVLRNDDPNSPYTPAYEALRALLVIAPEATPGAIPRREPLWCRNCGGSGLRHDLSTCPACQGSGKVEGGEL